jgi:hypothetical protein
MTFWANLAGLENLEEALRLEKEGEDPKVELRLRTDPPTRKRLQPIVVPGVVPTPAGT